MENDKKRKRVLDDFAYNQSAHHQIENLQIDPMMIVVSSRSCWDGTQLQPPYFDRF